MQTSSPVSQYNFLGRVHVLFYLFSATVLYLICIELREVSWHDLTNIAGEHWYFFFLGIFAAIVANSTGVGGGIIFLPAFIHLGLNPMQSLATSFAIQCFGMTSGSLAWLRFLYREHGKDRGRINYFFYLFGLSALFSVLGLLIVQWAQIPPPLSINMLFGAFSMIIALIILARIYFNSGQNNSERYSYLSGKQTLAFILTAFVGGGITAWISIGVGELLAVLLILYGFRTHYAIAIAVCVSAVTVLAGVWFHNIVTSAIEWNVLLFTAPGAIIGGAVARFLATAIEVNKLKTFMAAWILVSSIIYLLK